MEVEEVEEVAVARACVIGTMRAVTAERIGTEAIRAAVVTRRMIGGMEAVDTVATTVAAGRVEEEGVMTIGGGTMIVIAAVGTMTAGGERTTGIIIGGARELFERLQELLISVWCVQHLVLRA